MKQRPSEVFDNFAKIAAENGIVLAEAKESKSETSSIEAMYGVQPNGKDDDILDKAHPDPIIIAPSYDKLNGLVENLKERHNIMVGIVNKPPQGKLTQHRYAQQELFDELIRIGFLMDNQNEAELSTLADNCASQVVEKTAAAPVVAGAVAILPWVAAVAAVVGVVGVMNNFGGMIDQGVIKNADRAVSELQDVLNDSSYTHIASTVRSMIKNISYIKGLGSKALNVKFPSMSIEGAVDLVNSPQIKESNELIDEYVVACEALAEYIPSYIDILKVTPETDSERDSDWWAAVKMLGRYVYPEETKDAITALETLGKSLAQSRSKMESFKKAVHDFAEKNKEDIKSVIQNRLSAQNAQPAPIAEPTSDSQVASLEDVVKSKVKSKPTTIEPNVL